MELTPRPRSARGMAAGLVLAAGGIAAAACGDDNGTNVQAYTVAATQEDVEPQSDGGLQLRYSARVTDANGAAVPGAGLRFDVSVGAVSPTEGQTGTDGTGLFSWSISAGEVAGGGDAVLSACAENRVPARCDPQPVDTLPLD